MKLKITILTLVGVLTFAFIYNTHKYETDISSFTTPTVFSPGNGNTDKFYIGAMDDESDVSYNPSYSQLDTLGFNLWQWYCWGWKNQTTNQWEPIGFVNNGADNDYLNTPVSQYAYDVNQKINSIYSHNNRKLVIMRPKIVWLSYGQRSDYKCADVSHVDQNLWFYTFQSPGHIGQDEQDYDPGAGPGNGSTWVRHCRPINSTNQGNWVDNAGTVVSKLKANTEQCNRDTVNTSPDNQWTADNQWDWYVKPRIRIDSSIAHNPSNPLVCNIKILAADGQTVLINQDIHANDFLVDGQFHQYYNGRYLEEYYFGGNNPLIRHGDWATDIGQWWWNSRGNQTSEQGYNLADIQVYWYGQCDMWINYVRVDNEIGDGLLNPNSSKYNIYNGWIDSEATQILAPSGQPNRIFSCYMEQCEFNNIPCMAYVNQKLQQYSGGKVGIMDDLCYRITVHLPAANIGQVWNSNFLKTYYAQKVGFSQIFSECYALDACYRGTQYYSEYPSSLSANSNVLGNPVSTSVYDNYFNYTLYRPNCYFEGSLDWGGQCDNFTTPQMAGYFRSDMQICNSISNSLEIPFIYMPQAHQWFTNYEVHRQPTNEELDVFANLAVSYGAKGFLYFWYPSFNYPSSAYYPQNKHPLVNGDYGTGITKSWGGKLIDTNIYNETKPMWQQYKDIANRMKAWEPAVMNSTMAQSYNVATDGANHSYILGMESIDVNNSNPSPCYIENHRIDCPADCFWQMSFLNYAPQGNNSKFFLMVNRRCFPVTTQGTGDVRHIEIMFDANQLPTYNSWKLTDIASGNSIVFDKNNQGWDGLVDFGIVGTFQPGEGKLYKLSPVMVSGGTLVTDETVPTGDITVLDTVYNGGHNISVNSGANIHFTDSSSFMMIGGTFVIGVQGIQGPQNINVNAVNDTHWHGFTFQNCNVQIYGASFSNVLNDTCYALNLINCPLVDIRYSTFTNENGDNEKGGISAAYYYSKGLQNIYLGENTFNINQSVLPEVNVMSYAGSNIPLLIENNTFNSQNSGSTAMLLSGVTGGAIKSNSITDCGTGINLLSSSVDIFNNTINVSSFANCTGIFGASGSEVNMSPTAGMFLGGSNNISTAGTGMNIDVDNSFFFLDQGANLFNISDAQSWHLYGTFPSTALMPPTNQTDNCFKLSGTVVDPPYNYVTSMGQPVSFTFDPYLQGCNNSGIGAGSTTASLGNGINDTIITLGTGGGGGESENTKLNRLIVLNAKKLYDSLCVQMRFRHYSQAENMCYNLINTYVDSIQSVYSISKLFLASIGNNDTSQTAMTNLKTYYENLVLNNSGNLALVKRCNYFVQKCKVRLRDYSGALNGFQQIINQNPTSYEALVARWDYMATTLLMNGGGGGESLIDEPKSDEIDTYDSNDPNDKFTKEQRQVINSTVRSALVTSNANDNAIIEKLKQDAASGNISAARELKVKITLKEIVKTQKPKNIIEHLNIVRHDINKLFGKTSIQTNNNKSNIPTVFKLYQNYPNPFNPSTKINFDLPKDSKVKIIIYDVLGREVTKLINNELKQAGSYSIEFNATNYASGVYFYRIEADEINGLKHVIAKKMVLVK